MFVLEAFFFGFIQGFVIGPVTLYGVREGLNPRRGPWFQTQVILGATIVDLLYVLLATYGMASFVEYPQVKLAMWGLAAIMLMRMGYNSLNEKPTNLKFERAHRHKLQFYDNDFVKGFFLCLFNPIAVAFSVMVIGSLYATYQGGAGPLAFAISVNLGGMLCSTVIISLTYFIRNIFHPWMLKKMLKAGSFVLIGYGVYFGWKAFVELQPVVEAFSTSVLHA